MNRALDIFMIYHFLKRLVTPFDKWPAYKLGIIDAKGNTLKKRIELQSKEEKRAWTQYDILIRNLKQLINMVPGGNKYIRNFTAALLLLREEKMRKGEALVEMTTTVSSGVADTAKASPPLLFGKRGVKRRYKDFLKKKRKSEKKKKGVDMHPKD